MQQINTIAVPQWAKPSKAEYLPGKVVAAATQHKQLSPGTFGRDFA